MSVEDYNNDSIRSLKGEDRVRERVSVMLGSADMYGAFHTLKEIVGNSIDEHRAGYGTKLEVKRHADKSMSVRDYGRGVPLGWNEREQAWNWHLIYNDLYAGGKYDKTVGSQFADSQGENGVGASSTQYTSAYTRVESYREHQIFVKEFEKGKPLDQELLVLDRNGEPDGTYVKWLPDEDIFDSIDFTWAMLVDYCETQAYLGKIAIYLEDEVTGNSQVFNEGYANAVLDPRSTVSQFDAKGPEEYLRTKLGEKAKAYFANVVRQTGREGKHDYAATAEIVLAVTADTAKVQMHFHAASKMVAGRHYDAFEQAVRAFFRDIEREFELRIIPYDYEGYLSIITSTYSNYISFSSGQTKASVTNQYLFDMLYTSILNTLEEERAKQNEVILEMIENVRITAEARKRAKQKELELREAKKATQLKRGEKPDKLVECETEDNTIAEVYFVEGDSAAGACRVARDGFFQAILPLKGKPPNAFKTPLVKLLKNKEVRGISACIGTGAEVGDGELYDESKVNYARGILATDADSDGMQIRVLFFTIVAVLFPTLLRQGFFWIALTPLFEIVTKEGSVFAFDEAEKDGYLAEYRRKGVAIKAIHRSKGLGQNNADMLSETTMNPETRRLVPLQMDLTHEDVRNMLDMLFGNDSKGERRDFILALMQQGIVDDTSLALVEDMEKLEEDGLLLIEGETENEEETA